MSSKTINLTALSPYILYTGAWQYNGGATSGGKINVDPPPSRFLQGGTGTLTVNGFMNAINIRGQTGAGCTYTATIKSQRPNDSTSLPPAQTSPQDANLLVSFSGLSFGPYSLSLEANCNVALLQVTQVEMSLWTGDSGQTVTVDDPDDTSTLLAYSNNDWTPNERLRADFYNDTQHYTGTDGATVSLTLKGASAIILYGSLDPTHGQFRVNTSGPSTSLTTGTYNGSCPFLAVPVPLYIASGLDPRNEHTITMEKAGATYLDLDYVEVYRVGGGGPPGGELNAKSNSISTPALVGAVVGGVLGLTTIAVLIFYFIRRRRPKILNPYVSGVEKPERKLFGRKSNASSPHLHDPELASPTSPSSDTYFPTPYTFHGSTSAPSPSVSMFQPLTERPGSAGAPSASAVVARRHNKIAEMDQARRLAGSSSASALDPHEVPLPVTPDFAAAHRASAGAGSSIVPVVATATNLQSHPDDSHPVGLPDDPPPQYDTVV